MVPVKVHQLRLAGSSTNGEQKGQIRNVRCERDCLLRCWLAAFCFTEVCRPAPRQGVASPGPQVRNM